MEKAIVSFDADDRLYPPPLWWTRRIAAAVGLLLVVLGAFHLWWLHQARAALDAEIAAIQARGEPIWPSDFNPATRPEDEKNAAYHLRQTFTLFNYNIPPPAWSNMQYPDYPPFSAEWYDVSKKAIDAHQKVYQLARKARQQPNVDWGTVWATPTARIVLPSLSPSRHLAALLGDAALYAHLARGDDHEAIELIRDLLAEADAVDHHPNVVAHLVAIAIRASAMNRLEVIATEMRVAPEGAGPSATSKPAMPQQLRELIAILLKLGLEDRAERAYRGERMSMLDNGVATIRHSSLLRPMYLNDIRGMVSKVTAQMNAARRPNLPAALSGYPLRPLRTGTPSDLQHVVSHFWTPSLDRFVSTHFASRTEATLAAVSVAVRWYRTEHGGAFPPDLQSLVPDYLPAVPVDPNSPAGNLIGYITFRTHDGKPRPMVYSVSEDGVDSTRDRGATPPPEPQVHLGRLADQWRDLTRLEPPPPATQPVTP
jgi:hypothetical protein